VIGCGRSETGCDQGRDIGAQGRHGGLKVWVIGLLLSK
jgi:hypothetical protein